MTVRQLVPEHPVRACARVIGSALDLVAEVDPAYMTTADKASALVELNGLSARLEGLRLRVLAAADDVALDSGARSAAAWLAHHARTDIGPTISDGRLAASLESRWSQVRDALAVGTIHAAQARVIVRALQDLPADLDPEVRRQAETHLVEQAAHFDPTRLRRLGRKVLEVVAPEAAEAEERRLLEAEGGRARRVASLTMRRRGDGTTDIYIRISDAVAGRLRTYLEAYASPRRSNFDHDRGDPGDRVDPETGRHIPRSTLWATAFGAMLEAIPSDGLPRHGGGATSVVVTIDHDTLREQLGVAGLLDTDESITVSQAMRLACNASILPAVLDTTGQPPTSAARRLFSPAQRTAMALRDRQCRAHGCSIPAAWCEAHHTVPWHRGGLTDLEQGLRLCSWHHHRAHDRVYRTDTLPNGDLRFHRRT